MALCDGSTRSSRELGKLRWSRETEIAEPPAAADRALALLALRRALAVALEIGQPRLTWQSHAALARLHAACGRAEEARAADRAALTTISDLRAGTRDPGLQSGFASLPAIREIEDRARR